MDWLTEKLCAALRWQLANPDADPADGPEIPLAGARVWGIFCDLSASRGGGFGPAPLTPEAVVAYSRLQRDPIKLFELKMIGAMDKAFMEWAAESAKAKDPAAPVKVQVQTRPLTPALFDAMFP